MNSDLKIPKWSGLSKKDLRKIDLGRRVKPISQSEAESGLVLRGPVVLSALPATPDAAKKRLPIIMTNVRLLNRGNRFFVEYTGSPFYITEFEIRPVIRPVANGLVVTTIDGTPAKLRRLLNGDLQLFRFAKGVSETEVSGFLEVFWSSE